MSEGIEEKLDRYGKWQHEFLACGELIDRDDNKVEATVHIRQLTNGRLLVGFVLTNSPDLPDRLALAKRIWKENDIFTKFDGHLKDTADKVTIPLEYPKQAEVSLLEFLESPTIIYQPRKIEIGNPNFGEATVKYEICNFCFIGTESRDILPLRIRKDTLPLRIDKFDFQITQLEDYEEAIEEIEARKNVRQTSEITIRTQIGGGEELNLITKRVDEVCALLSIARGTLITWTSLRYTNDEQKDHQYRCFRNSVTRPYSVPQQ